MGCGDAGTRRKPLGTPWGGEPPWDRTRGPKKQFSKEQIKAALYLSGGVITQAAKALGLSAETLRLAVGQYPDLQAYIVNVCRPVVGEIAEGNIVADIQKGSVETSKWFVARTNKERFSTRTDTGKDAGPIEVATQHVVTDAELLAMPQEARKALITGMEAIIAIRRRAKLEPAGGGGGAGPGEDDPERVGT
jgi:Bacterial regulatory protein, Fis family